MTKKIKILISGGYGNGNAGDEALMVAMLSQLREYFPTGKFIIFSDDPAYSRSHYPGEYFIYSGRFGFFEPNQKGLKRIFWIFQSIAAFLRCAIFITGGGTILQDQTHRFFIPFWLSKVFVAQLFLKKTVMYGIGAGPITTPLGRFLTRVILNRMTFIGLRGSYSLETLRNIGVHERLLKLTADPALTLACTSTAHPSIPEPQHIDPSRLKIAFIIRRWYVKHINNIHQKHWLPGGEEKYHHFIAECARLADTLIDQHNASIFFIPMSCKPPNDDRLAIADTVQEIKHKEHFFSIQQDLTCQDIKGFLKQMDALIGMRFHSLVFFAEFLKPMIGIAYGKKTYDFMTELGLQDFILDVDTFSSQTTTDKMRLAIEQYRDKLFIAKLSETVTLQKARVGLNARAIYTILNGNTNETL